ncbi:hypothetical protein RB195_009070 [Necator americanus]|uniref:Thioredoxin domain-containing protein n=1 Tax=Necator americanus TaxID=51031 RepID=A0ABR1CV10_NECAM
MLDDVGVASVAQIVEIMCSRTCKAAQGSHIKLAKVDATVEKTLAEKYGVSGFPTLKIQEFRFEYKGPREAYGIVKYMTEQALPAAKKLDGVFEVERFMVKDDVTIIGFFATESSSAFEAFSDAAEMLREEFKSMGYVSDPKAFKKYDAKPNDIIIFYPSLFQSKFEPKSRTFNKAGATLEELLSFFRDHSAPLVGKRTRSNVATRYSKFPLVVVYYNADFSLQYREGSEYWRQKVLNIAQKYQKDKYIFAVSDEEEFAEELESVGLGKAKAFVKSAPLPRDDKGPLRTLVGSNFDKIVNDESKDVLIEFYAPWCGHCKAFEPKYKELAANLKKTQPNLIIAKMDATANDAPSAYSVGGFPTIYFAPSGKKSTPIKYEGNRDLDHLTKFMESNAVKSFQKKEEL